MPTTIEDRIAALETRTPLTEDRYAGRVLAWAGAAATVLGLALLLVMAATRGWLGEEARVVLAAVASALLFLAGGRLYERRGRTDAAKAMAAAGIVGLDGALVAATAGYGLLDPLVAVVVALLVAAGMSALCLRWEARDLAATAMLGALLAPAALGAGDHPVVLALLAVAFAAVAWVCVRRDWAALGLAAFAVTTPQWVALLGSTTTLGTLLALTAFAVLGAALAVGLEVRERRSTLRRASAVLLAFNALVVAGAGYLALSDPGVGKAWLAAVALAHLAGALGLRRIGGELRLTALTLGVLLGDLALSAIFDGAWLAAAWAGSTLLFAGLNRLRADHEVAAGGLALHASLALGHLLIIDARPADLHAGFGAAGLLSLSLVAAACLVSAQISVGRWRMALQGLALAVAAYGTVAVCSGPGLVFTLALETVALARLARREDAPAAGPASLAYLGLAVLAMLISTDAPEALQSGTSNPLAAAAMVAACAGAAALTKRAQIAAGAIILYGISIEIVAAFPHVQQGQVVLSAFYATTGVALVVAGLLEDRRAPRLAGLGLLVTAAAKVLLYDLAELDEIYRVLSCTALGVLLLAGAFAWQRLRPSALEDLRAVAAPLR